MNKKDSKEKSIDDTIEKLTEPEPLTTWISSAYIGEILSEESSIESQALATWVSSTSIGKILSGELLKESDYITAPTPLETSGAAISTTVEPHELKNPMFHTFPNDLDIFRNAIKEFPQLTNKDVSKSVLILLLTFQKIILTLINQLNFSGYLPPLQLRQNDDESALLEWIFSDFRIGFVIETEIPESSWYLVSNSNLDELSKSGTLNVEECESRIYELFSFVIKNV